MNPEPELGPTPTTRPYAAYCRTCGKGLWEEDVVRVLDVVYCREHSPRSPANPYVGPQVAPPGGGSPGLAFVLGLIPGVGAIYNGQYGKGFVHVFVTGVILTLADSHFIGGVFVGFLIPAWFLYMAFEAYHTARKRLSGEYVDEFSSILPAKTNRDASLLVPVALIAVGAVLLMQQFEWIDLRQVRRFAVPVVLIVAGLGMLFSRLRGKEPEKSFREGSL